MNNVCQKGNTDEEPTPKRSVRKLFTPQGKKKGNTTPPIVATKTPSGYQLTPRKDKNTPSKLVRPTVPKVYCLFSGYFI